MDQFCANLKFLFSSQLITAPYRKFDKVTKYHHIVNSYFLSNQMLKVLSFVLKYSISSVVRWVIKNASNVYSTANPHVSSTAWVSLSHIFSFVSYGGRSSLLKHVWALGKFMVGASIWWRVNNLGPAAPVDPCRALNPCSGT